MTFARAKSACYILFMELIKNAAEKVCQSLNVFMENIEKRTTPWVVLTSLVDHDGSTNRSARDCVVMTVYNITRESFASSLRPNQGRQAGQSDYTLAMTNPPIYIDLHLMFMANFAESSYGLGLRALSQVISFFQQNQTFTQSNTPGLAPQLTQLTMDLENLSPVDVNYVMGMLGTKYLPSAFYKMRMLPFDSSAMMARSYVVQDSAAPTGVQS
jgi:hypothetical protein